MVGQGGVVECDIKALNVDRSTPPSMQSTPLRTRPGSVGGGGQRGTGHGGPKRRFRTRRRSRWLGWEGG